MTEGVRESTNRGDLQYESQEVTGTKGNPWFVIWEKGETDTHVGVRADSNFPKDLEVCR